MKPLSGVLLEKKERVETIMQLFVQYCVALVDLEEKVV